MTVTREKDCWLPPEPYDPKKFKPRRLEPDEYDIMAMALQTVRKWAEKVGPEKVQELIGAIEIKKEEIDPTKPKPKPPIFRSSADRWACEDCNARGDKWYLQDHICSGSKKKKREGKKKE